MGYYSVIKRNEPQKKHGGTLNAYYLSQEANLQRLHTVRFQLYDTIFRSLKLFCMILQWWICIIIYFSKSIEYITQRVNPNANCKLWGIKI